MSKETKKSNYDIKYEIIFENFSKYIVLTKLYFCGCFINAILSEIFPFLFSFTLLYYFRYKKLKKKT